MAEKLHRDIQCSFDVGEMAKLGRFEREFAVYGCAYRENNETYFRISEHEETICRFIEASRLAGIIPTMMHSHSQRTGVPSGTEETIWREEESHLGHLLAESYSDEFLLRLERLNALPSANGGYAPLKEWQEQIDGRFQREEQQIFDNFVDLCYQMKQLNADCYAELKRWSAYNWKQMEDDIIIKNSYERTLHGILYEENGIVQIVFDAQYAAVYRRRQLLLQKGLLVTPIYSKTFWFQTFSDFDNVKKDYQSHLREILAPQLSLLRQLTEMAPFITAEDFAAEYAQVYQEGTPQEAETLKMYGRLWNCLPLAFQPENSFLGRDQK